MSSLTLFNKTVFLLNYLTKVSLTKYFAEKKAKFRGIFRGKFAEKSTDFTGFSWEKGRNSPKNQPISGIFAGKKSKFAEKSGDFAGF